MLSHNYQKVNSSIVSKGVMNSFNEMFPLARMFPQVVMNRVFLKNGRRLIQNKKSYSYEILERSYSLFPNNKN